MSFKSKGDFNLNLDDQGREPGKPHPDWQNNYAYFCDMMNNKEVQKKMKNLQINYRVHGTNERKTWDKDRVESVTFETPTHCTFSWKENGDSHAFPLNFHVRNDSFRKTMQGLNLTA